MRAPFSRSCGPVAGRLPPCDGWTAGTQPYAPCRWRLAQLGCRPLRSDHWRKEFSTRRSPAADREASGDQLADVQDVGQFRADVRCRSSESVALAALDDGVGVDREVVDSTQELERFLVFYPLGDNERPGLSREGRHRHEYRSRGGFGCGGGDDAPVEFHKFSVDCAQDLKAGVARADIVDRDSEALLAEPVQSSSTALTSSGSASTVH